MQDISSFYASVNSMTMISTCFYVSTTHYGTQPELGCMKYF